jgi:hypothetical protein
VVQSIPICANHHPKSTGRELFGWTYFQQCQRQADQQGLNDFDLVATLTQFTAATIAQSYQGFLPALPDAVLVCGGGGYNPVLMEYLQDYLPGIPDQSHRRGRGDRQLQRGDRLWSARVLALPGVSCQPARGHRGQQNGHSWTDALSC